MKVFAYVMLLGLSHGAYAQKIATIAGLGAGIGCDYYVGAAIDSRFLYPGQIAIDNDGNIYVTDLGGNTTGPPGPCPTVRKIDTSGKISTIAGGGRGGDGTPATAADLNAQYLLSLAVDGSGNVFVADEYGVTVRKINSSGIITTFAGGAPMGVLGDGGPATSASIINPMGLAVDGTGNLYIADFGNGRIRKVDTFGNISTVAGGGTSGLGDGGPATAADLNPYSVVLDKSGNMYIGEIYRVRKINTSGTITTVAGNGTYGLSGDGRPATDAQVSEIFGIAIDDDGNVYIADYDNSRVRKIDPSGLITTVAGTTKGYGGDGGPATAAHLNEPVSVAVDHYGHIFIADGSILIREISDSNFVVSKISSVSVTKSPLKAFPNPNSGSFNLQLPETGSAAIITITDILGSTIETRTIQNTQPQNLHFDLRVPPGTYIVKVCSDGQIWREKVEVW